MRESNPLTRRHKRSRLAALAKVGVIVGNPVLAGWCEDVKVNSIFKSLGGVGQAAGNDQNLAFADSFLDRRILLSQQEPQGPLGDVRDLFIGVLVARNEAAFFQFQAGEHGLRTGDELAFQQGIELCGGNFGPARVK